MHPDFRDRYNDGYWTGYADGTDNGHHDGYREGEKVGFDRGVKASAQDVSFHVMVGDCQVIAAGPIRCLRVLRALHAAGTQNVRMEPNPAA